MFQLGTDRIEPMLSYCRVCAGLYSRKPSMIGLYCSRRCSQLAAAEARLERVSDPEAVAVELVRVQPLRPDLGRMPAAGFETTASITSDTRGA